jgi:hypothetical protein
MQFIEQGVHARPVFANARIARRMTSAHRLAGAFQSAAMAPPMKTKTMSMVSMMFSLSADR